MGCAVSKGSCRVDSDFAVIQSMDYAEDSADDFTTELSVCYSSIKSSTTGHRGLVGLKNLGNSCFLNASIQCLSNTAPLVDYFLKRNWQKDINRGNPLGKSGEVAQCFGDLIRQMWARTTENTVISPDNFRRILGFYQPQFCGYEQHDAQELLAFLLDGLHEDLNRVKLKPYVEDVESDGTKTDSEIAALSWTGYLLRNRSVIVDLSQGQLRSTLRCLTCDTRSIKFDTFMYLSLPIVKSKKKSVTIRSCIREFCRAEVLTGDCQWRCPKCKGFRDAEKKLSLWTLPPILIIHLKRFEYDRRGGRSKIEDLVKFPLKDLDLGPLIPNLTSGPATYDLYGVSNHLGGDMGGGHYTAIAKNRIDKNWYLFNDSVFRPVGNDVICSRAAYVLFYQKRSPPTNFDSAETTDDTGDPVTSP